MPIDVKVSAKARWTNTGVLVEAGKEILVAYMSGTWTCNPASSAGYDAHGFDGHPAKKDYVVEGSNEGGLVGKVGDKTFWIGRVGVVRDVGSGHLFLSINDDQNKEYGVGYDDNDGELNVRIVVSDVALPAVWMLVDADRNDTLSSQVLDEWTQGPNTRGAILIPNESGSGATRLSTPLVFQILPGAPRSMRGRIEVDRADRIRVLAAGGGSAEPGVVLGEAGPNHRITQHEFDLVGDEVRFEMEATRYLRREDEDPFVTLTFTPLAGERAGEAQRAKLRVAPWLMMHHGNAPELVYVAAPGPQDPTFRQIVGAWPLPIQDLAVPDSNSVFIQDGVEIGYARASARRTKFQGLRSPVPRWLTRMTTEVLGFDVIQVEATDESIDNRDTGRAFGNLEVTPPLGTYDLGRIYYSPKIEQVQMDFLNAQRVQRPFLLDASWLAVGHVDEVVCFLPRPGKCAVALVPSPRLAYRLICETAVVDPGAALLRGRSVATVDAPRPAEQSLVEFLKQPTITGADDVSLGSDEDEEGHFDVQTLRDFAVAIAGLAAEDARRAQYVTVRDALAQGRFYPTSVQAKLQATVIDVISGIFPPPSVEIVQVPVVFYSVRRPPEALTANLVNSLVLGARCLFPRPFGPVVTRPVTVTSDLGGPIAVAQGADVFEVYMTDVLARRGFTGTAIDTWDQYHLQHGEIHCATNVKRVPGATPWWTLPGLG